MTSATAESMITRVRDLADDGGSVPFNTNAQILNWLNDGLEELHNLVVQSSQEYIRERKTYTFDGRSPSEYPVPADMMKALGMDLVVSTTTRRRMERFQNAERNTRQTGVSGSTPWGAPMYRIVGEKVEVIPGQSSGTAELFYVPEFKRLKEMADQPAGYVKEGWETFAVYHAAYKCVEREEGDVRPFLRDKEARAAQIVAFLTPRDAGEHLKVIDTQGIADRESGGW